MTQMNLRLPDDLGHRIQEEAERRGFSSSEEYVQSVVEADLIRAQLPPEEELEKELLQAMDSGPGTIADDGFWKRFRAECQRRMAERGSSR